MCKRKGEMSFIEVRNLSYEYCRLDEDGGKIKHLAVDDVSMNIEKGSFVAICGINGSGKSTLAKNLNGLLVPDSGEVLVDGISTKDDERIWDVRKRVAMVFQNPDNQIVSSIVEDDVAFGPENLGIEPAEIRRRVDDALNQVSMYKYRNKGAHMLSGGQKQRIAIAGAIAMKPECIVFDEPTAMLDPKGRKKILKIIKELNKEGITIILITHFMTEAACADRLIVMKDGKVFSDSTPSEFYSDRKLVTESGLEMPPVIELREILTERGIDIPGTVMDEDSLIDFIKEYR